MQTLRFDSAITGLSSHAPFFVVGTDDGSLFFLNTQTSTIDRQFSLPPNSAPFGAPVWSGDFIWVPSDCTAFFFPENDIDSINSVQISESISRLFVHPCQSAVFALHSPNSVSVLQASGASASRTFENCVICAIVIRDGKAVIVTESGLFVADPMTLEIEETIEFVKRRSAVSFAQATEFGIVVVWADGFWARFSDGIVGEGNSIAASGFDLVGSHLAAACGDCVKLFDLRFEAELQSVSLPANMVVLFEKAIVGAAGTVVTIRELSGLQRTTTRDLIGSAPSVESRELKVGIAEFQPNLKSPLAEKVELRDPTFKFRSAVEAVDRVIEHRSVPQAVKQSVVDQVEGPEYEDIRELAKFHLRTSIPFEEIREQMRDGKNENVLVALKKVETLGPEQIAEFIRLALGVLDSNEIILAHFLVQSHTEKAAREAAALLTVDEVDAVLHFLAKMVRSRRYWREYHVLFGAFDAVLAWSSWLVTATFSALTIQGRTEGLAALRRELVEEAERIHAAGACWSIMENIHQDKTEVVPPSFMYVVERIDTGLPD
jgi:hypothetical protein